MTGARAAMSVLTLSAAALALGACRSTQETSRIKARQATAVVQQKGLAIKALNRDAKVVDAAVVSDANGTAAVVEIRNRGAAQAAVPVGLVVQDSTGRALYANDAPGLERSLVEAPLLDPRGDTVWVNNQIPALSGGRRVAKVRLGVARAKAPGAVPRIEISKVRLGTDSSGVYAKGVITNRSNLEQRLVVVSAVARRHGKVVAAGRAIVEKLPPAPAKRPTLFTVFFIGNPKGATLTFSAPPTVLR